MKESNSSKAGQTSGVGLLDARFILCLRAACHHANPVTAVKGIVTRRYIHASFDILIRFERSSKSKKFMPKSVCKVHDQLRYTDLGQNSRTLTATKLAGK